jgi:hypothetical protein
MIFMVCWTRFLIRNQKNARKLDVRLSPTGLQASRILSRILLLSGVDIRAPVKWSVAIAGR